MSEKIKISVRDLIGFVYQSGDMKTVFVSQKRALAGTRAHQKIQKSRPEGYLPEVTVRYEYIDKDVCVELQGRIDGIQPGDPYTLEEIKSTFRILEEITPENSFMHWAQAKMYAFIFAQQNSLTNLDIMLTYYQLDTDEIREITLNFSLIELEEFFQTTMRLYHEWAVKMSRYHSSRNIWLSTLLFPYGDFRQNQREMSVATYNAVRNKEVIFIQAPTGIGKTVGTLYPALKALGEEKLDKIFYLTAKTVGREVALDTLRDITAKHKLKTVVLTAKEKVCFNPGHRCDGDDCPWAKGYFDRQKDAGQEVFNYDIFTREVIDEIANRHFICPFEFSLYLSLFADVIIADYNYAFDPTAYLRRFFDPVNGDYFFLIDEAHNFPERTREMYSAEVNLWEVSKAVKALKDNASEEIVKNLKSIERHLIKWRKEMKKELLPERVEEEIDKNLMRKIKKFINDAEVWLAYNIRTDWREALLDIYFVLRQFVRSSEYMNERFTFYLSNRDKFFIKIYCMDPSELNKECLKRAIGTVFFSATLLPDVYFTYFCGGTGEEP
ncbi:MAG: ATP-dependent DNA helicase, partial [Candidatus Cloacimonetes bacterium]|nr:ATP-dependent DNA helicase [Candidatus Cloacimonadota bacterium]